MAKISTLTSDQRNLLERLYNLKGDDSTIIADIKRSIADNKNDNQSLSSQKEDFQHQKDAKTDRKSELDSQYERILKDLNGIVRANYATVLDEANESFDPEAMLQRIQEKIPNRLTEIAEQIRKLEERISKTEKELEENSISATELEEKLADAERVRADLSKLIEESLRGNGSMTRDTVGEILIKLGFNADEINELGKMIIFPQGTLDEFNSEYTLRTSPGKSIAEVLGSAKAATETTEEETQKIVHTDSAKPVESPKSSTTPSEKTSIVSTDGNEKKGESKLTDNNEFYTATGLKKGRLSNDAIAELTSKNANELIKSNYNLLNSLEISEANIYKYYTVLVDSTLADKIKFFQELGKTSIDLNLTFEILLVYTYEELQELQKICDEYGIALSDIPLPVLRNGLTNYLANLEYLSGKHVELDKGEIKKCGASIAVLTENFKSNYEMLAKYNYNLTKKNGKTALQPLAQDPIELANGLDAVIETGEDQVFDSAPEKLSVNLMDLANRIAYCHKNNVPLYNENGNPHKFIFDEGEFAKVFEGTDVSKIKELPTLSEAEKSLTSVLNNSPIIEVLKSMDLAHIYLEGRDITEDEIYFEVQTYLGDLTNYENDSHRMYNIEGIMISKEKFERNLIYLLNHKVGAPNREILLASLLYGSLKTEEEMKKVSNAISFSEPKVGGVQL